MTHYRAERMYYDNTPTRSYGSFYNYQDIKDLVKGFKLSEDVSNHNMLVFARKKCNYFSKNRCNFCDCVLYYIGIIMTEVPVCTELLLKSY